MTKVLGSKLQINLKKNESIKYIEKIIEEFAKCKPSSCEVKDSKNPFPICIFNS